MSVTVSPDPVSSPGGAAAAIKTAKVTGRRVLHFDRLEDIRADLDRLEAAPQLKTLGNWTADQIFNHLAKAMDKSIDGFENPLPAPLRVILRLLIKNRLLNKPMSAGFKLPAKAQAELTVAPGGLADAFANLRRALDRVQTESRRAPNPAVGPLTAEEWNRLHCRHCELHLSFLVAAEL